MRELWLNLEYTFLNVSFQIKNYPWPISLPAPKGVGELRESAGPLEMHFIDRIYH